MFVTFEGPEGAGKTTLVTDLADRLSRLGREVVVTREPGSGQVGGAIRQILLHGNELDSKAELFLFLADRAQHVAEVISPALRRGAIVLCDRYSDSTVVYQGYGRGLDLNLLRTWNAFATAGLEPDLTVLLDLEVSIGLSRIASKDRLDSEPLEFHRRIREGFLREAELAPRRWVLIDADRTPSEISAEVERHLLKREGESAHNKC